MEKEKDIADIKGFVKRLVLFAGIIYLLFGILFGVQALPNNDMKPRLMAGDLAFFYRYNAEYRNGEAVIYTKDGKICCGRVIAVPGEKVEIDTENGLRINDSLVLEGDVYYKTGAYEGDVRYPVTLKEDEYFILADMREGGKDSRYFGPVKKTEIKGKIIAVLRKNEI